MRHNNSMNLDYVIIFVMTKYYREFLSSTLNCHSGYDSSKIVDVISKEAACKIQYLTRCLFRT